MASSLAKVCAAGEIESVFAGREMCDISNEGKVFDLISSVKPDAVVNAAAYTAVDKAEQDSETAYLVNATGAGNIARVAAQFEIPALHISTDYVFLGDKKTAYLESDQTNPSGVYGASKLAGEKIFAESNSKHLIMRTAWVYSQTGNNFVKTMLRLASQKDEISVVGDQFGNPTSADEIAHAIMGALKKMLEIPSNENYGIFHFTGTEKMSWAEFAKTIFATSAKLGGPTAEVKEISSSEYPTAAKRPENSCLDNSKFKSAFGLKQVPFLVALEAVVVELLRSESLN